MKNIETAIVAALQGDELPTDIDLPAAVQQVLDHHALEQVGRLTLRYLLERHLARLRARKEAILAATDRPPLH